MQLSNKITITSQLSSKAEQFTNLTLYWLPCTHFTIYNKKRTSAVPPVHFFLHNLQYIIFYFNSF